MKSLQVYKMQVDSKNEIFAFSYHKNFTYLRDPNILLF